MEENLQHFDRMKRGEYLEGQASLRMKGNLTSDNPAMWDPVFYRVKHTPPHARTGLNWCIYPSYDLSHCIVDSIEGITHSCCTLEFASRQAADGPYYWILDKLDRCIVSKPPQFLVFFIPDHAVGSLTTKNNKSFRGRQVQASDV